MKEKLREKVIEKYLIDKVANLGGKAYKFSSPNNRAVPDRLCVFPRSILAFVECKASDKTVDPKSLQNKIIKSLRDLGQVVLIINSKSQVDTFIEVTKIELQRRKETRK
jgi:hypothetical protein